jgi:hypothetical protein
VTRKSVSSLIRYPRLIYNLVLETRELSVHFELPWSVETLIGDMHQTLLICENDELTMLKVRTPLLYSNQDCQIFFVVSREAAGTGT